MTGEGYISVKVELWQEYDNGPWLARLSFLLQLKSSIGLLVRGTWPGPTFVWTRFLLV